MFDIRRKMILLRGDNIKEKYVWYEISPMVALKG